jgi:hypothetical protein
MLTLTEVSMTQDDMDGGHPRNSWDCPCHRALRRVIRDDVNFQVGIMSVIVRTPRRRYFIDLPKVAADAVSRLYHAIKVEPFTFQVKIPTELLR